MVFFSPRAVSAEPAGILIVEDEGLIAGHISSRLAKTGFQVVGIAESSEEAIAKVPELNPELVLMDIRIKGERDGIETAAILRDRFDVPVIYLTAHTDRQTIDRAKTTGAFGFLSKPIHHATLANTIEMAIHKHRADRAMRNQRAWMATVLSTMANGVAVIDRDRKVRFLNAPAEQLTGWSAEEANGRDLGEVLPLMNPATGAAPPGVFSCLDGEAGTGHLPAGLVALRRSGPGFPIEGEIAPSIDGGRVAGAVLTFRDATSRIERENEIRHQQKMQAVGRLAAGITHDFNNLLFIILGYADEMLRAGGHGQAEKQALTEIRRAAESAAGITDQLLKFSRRERAERRDINLNRLIGETEELFRRMAGPAVRWQFRLDRNLRTLRADEGQMRQVLMNLTANARDAMPGGGRITIETVNVDLPRAGLSGIVKEKYVALSVNDTGGGISPEAAGHLFEPFFTTKEIGRGTGLGLSIVHSIVTDLGGTIHVDSDAGRGATFTLYLPAGAAAEDRTSAGVPEPAGDGSSDTITVLLLEDQESVRTLLRGYLESAGCIVLEAGDGADAMRIADEYAEPIDLLVTDVMVPRPDGLDVARALAARRPALRVLLISGLAEELLPEPGDLPAGARFLPKPFIRTELLRVVTELVGAEKSRAPGSFRAE